MRFKVTQDVQRADQIIGPLTWKQLIMLGAGGGICYAIYVGLAKTYYMEVWLPPIVIVGGLTVALTFLKIYGLDFEKFLLCFIEFHFLPKKRIWKKGQAEPFVSYLQRKVGEDKKLKEAQNIKKEQKSSKSIKELSKILDSHGGLETDSTATLSTTSLDTDPEVLAEIEAKNQKKEALKNLINHKI